MAQYGMLIDLKACTGCKACMTACKAYHSIPFGEYEGREYYRIWPEEEESGEYPYVIRNMAPLLCMQCEDPPCVKVCPVSRAIYRREDGLILVNPKKCNGCGFCIPACPYGAIYLREDKMIADKCNFCVDDIDVGKQPICVLSCPSDAMFFGDLEEPESMISTLLKNWDARPLHPEYKTKPSVYYTDHAMRLKGTIVSKETGYGIQGATITINCLNENNSDSMKTDSYGAFFFWNLKPRRKYVLLILVNGIVSNEREIYIDKEYVDLGMIPI